MSPSSVSLTSWLHHHPRQGIFDRQPAESTFLFFSFFPLTDTCTCCCFVFYIYMYQLFSLLFYLADTRTRYCLIHEPFSRFVFSQSLEDAGTRPTENIVRIYLPKEKIFICIMVYFVMCFLYLFMFSWSYLYTFFEFDLHYIFNILYNEITASHQ